jgi:hypothetical protein
LFCTVEDLYDFNYECKYPAREAAVLQLGYGAGGFGRTSGAVYEDIVFVEYIYANPFGEWNPNL